MEERSMDTSCAADPTRATDAKLVRDARQGDTAAFEALTARHFPMVYALAYARLGAREAAEDLAQEVFLLATLHLGALTDPARFAAWLGRIARNEAGMWRRRSQSASRLVRLVPLDDLPAEPAAQASQEARAALEADEETRALHEALFRLPEALREVVLLHYFEDLSKAEIAKRLEVHPATVGRQIEKALKAMKRTLEPILRRAAPAFCHSGKAAARTTLLVAAVAAMSAPAKAALLAEAGASVAALAVATQTVAVVTSWHTIFSGGFLMSVKAQVAAILIALAIIAGVTYHQMAQSPVAPKNSAVLSANVGSPKPAQPPTDVAATQAAGQKDAVLFRLRVADGTGQPVPGAEATLHKVGGDAFGAQWVPVSGDPVSFTRAYLESVGFGPDYAGTYMIAVRAKGYAPCLLQSDTLSGGDLTREVSVAMDRGRTIELTLRDAAGRPIPETLEPAGFFTELATHAWYQMKTDPKWPWGSTRMDVCRMEKLGGGRYRFQWSAGAPDLYIMVSEPGFLRGYMAGPFTREQQEQGKIEIELPVPGSLEVAVHPPQGFQGASPYKACSVMVFESRAMPPKSNGGVDYRNGRGIFDYLEETQNGTQASVVLNDLPPGDYVVEGQARAKSKDPRMDLDIAWSKRQGVTIRGGDTAKLDFEYTIGDKPKAAPADTEPIGIEPPKPAQSR